MAVELQKSHLRDPEIPENTFRMSGSSQNLEFTMFVVGHVATRVGGAYGDARSGVWAQFWPESVHSVCLGSGHAGNHSFGCPGVFGGILIFCLRASEHCGSPGGPDLRNMTNRR